MEETMSDHELRRSHLGFVIPEDAPRPKTGENQNFHEYKDGKGKANESPDCKLPDGRPKYAKDGVSTDWWDTHPRPAEK